MAASYRGYVFVAYYLLSYATLLSVLCNNVTGNADFMEFLEERGYNPVIGDRGSFLDVGEGEVRIARSQEGGGQITCKQRKKCALRPSGAEYGFYEQNCYCDADCRLYDDCCRDYDGPDPGNFRLSRRTLSCTRIIEIDPMSEIYRVDSCPRDYQDAFVKEKCENAVMPETFLEIPVSSRDTGLLYRNYYCAICAGDTNLVIWNIKWKCNREPSGFNPEDTDLFLDDIWMHGSGGCSFEYVAPHPGVTYRKCKSNLSRCPKSYRNDRVAQKCKRYTSYVYVGENPNQIFRNEFCAECYGVNETYLSCDDPRIGVLPDASFYSPEDTLATSPLTLLLNINTGQGTRSVHRDTDGDGTPEEQTSTINLRQCPHGQVYDPFSTVCRQLFCPDGSEFERGACSSDDGDRGEEEEDEVELTQGIPGVQLTTSPPSLATTSQEREVGFPGVAIQPIRPLDASTQVPGDPRNPEDPRTGDDMLVGGNGPRENLWNKFQDVNTPKLSECALVGLRVGEYMVLANDSVYVHPYRATYDNGDYIISDSILYICSPTPAKRSGGTNTTGSDLLFQLTPIQRLMWFVGMLISIFFLFICLVVYLMLSPLRNLAGKCVISLTVSLMLAQGILVAATHLSDYELACLVVGVASHYTVMVVFAWANCMAIDICRALSHRQSSGADSPRRFSFYSLYAWVVPALVVGGSLTLHFVEEIPVPDTYRPMYGEGICWITQISALLFLFAAPLALLVFINIVLFVVSAGYLCTTKATTTKASAQRAKDKNRLLAYVMLTFLVALPWVFALLAILLDMGELWYVFIALNAVQGAFICFAFVCTRKVFRLLRGLRRVHRTSSASSRPASYSNGLQGNAPPHWAYSRPNYRYSEDDDDEEPGMGGRVISQETSI